MCTLGAARVQSVVAGRLIPVPDENSIVPPPVTLKAPAPVEPRHETWQAYSWVLTPAP